MLKHTLITATTCGLGGPRSADGRHSEFAEPFSSLMPHTLSSRQLSMTRRPLRQTACHSHETKRKESYAHSTAHFTVCGPVRGRGSRPCLCFLRVDGLGRVERS